MSEPAAVEEPKDQETTVEKLSEGVAQTSIVEDEEQQSEAGPSSSTPAPEVEYDDAHPAPESDDDGDNSEDDEETGGEWITPHNVNKFKARDLGLSLPEESQRGSNAQPKKPRAIMKSACMTSDFAVQNVLLQMGLNLVGGEGRRIRSVRSWVLRCHACFKYVSLTLSTPQSLRGEVLTSCSLVSLLFQAVQGPFEKVLPVVRFAHTPPSVHHHDSPLGPDSDRTNDDRSPQEELPVPQPGHALLYPCPESRFGQRSEARWVGVDFEGGPDGVPARG